MEVKSNRNKYMDIIKSIGIISIVIGHSCWKIIDQKILIGPFVYSYHIMIFFVISGFLYNEDKIYDNKTLFKYLINQIIKMIKIFFLYNLFFVIMHNFFVNLKIIDSSFYTDSILIKNIFNGLRFITKECLLGAFWFIPAMLVSKMLFSFTYYLTKKNKILTFIVMLFYAILGILLCYYKIFLPYKIQVSILSVFFIYTGLIMKKNWNILKQYIYKFGWIPSGIIMYLIVLFTNSSIDLSVNKIINPVIFLMLTFIGIYFCFSLAKVINKNKIISNLFSIIGKNSLHIMALHFLIIKLIDLIYSKIHLITETNIITKFPYAFDIWYFYIPIAVLVPVVIINLPKLFKGKRERNNE